MVNPPKIAKICVFVHVLKCKLSYYDYKFYFLVSCKVSAALYTSHMPKGPANSQLEWLWFNKMQRIGSQFRGVCQIHFQSYGSKNGEGGGGARGNSLPSNILFGGSASSNIIAMKCTLHVDSFNDFLFMNLHNHHCSRARMLNTCSSHTINVHIPTLLPVLKLVWTKARWNVSIKSKKEKKG